MFFGCEIIDKHLSCYSCQKVTVKGNVHGRKSKVSSRPSKNFSIFYLTLTVSMARALHTVNCYYCFIFTFSSCFLPFFQFSRGFSIEPPGQPLDHHPRDFPTIFVQRCQRGCADRMLIVPLGLATHKHSFLHWNRNL